MIQRLSETTPIGDHPHEKTWHVDDHVVKVTRLPDDATLVSPHAASVCNDHARVLTYDEIVSIGLEPRHRWAMISRPFVDGTTLDSAEHGAAEVASLAMAIRDLHELGIAHGDIQPANVVVHDRVATLIDVPLFLRKPGESGHVAGAAPYIAPEIWRGGDATLESDVYAFCAVAVEILAGHRPIETQGIGEWVMAHESIDPDLTGVPTDVGPIIARGLAKESAERPPIQQLIDAFDAVPLPPMVSRDFLGHQALAQNLVLKPATVTTICAPPRGGLTTFLNWFALHAEIAGEVVVAIDRDQVTRPLQIPLDIHDPWSTPQSIVQSLGGETFEWSRGDRLHLFEQFCEKVTSQLTVPTWFLVDDFDTLGPDLSAWWRHFASRTQSNARFVFGGHDRSAFDAIDVQLHPPEASAWNSWRSTTLRTEVRDIGQGRWEQLVTQHGHTLGTMLDALNDELGIDVPGKERVKLDTASVSALGARWRDELDDLMTRCAFGRACAMSEQLANVFLRREKMDDAVEVARRWTDAIIASGEPDQTALIETLDQLSARWDATESLVRLLHATGDHTDALARLDSPPDDAPQDALLAWRAQLCLSSGDFDAAKSHADRGLKLDPLSDSARVRLSVARFGADAIFGDQTAIDELRNLVPHFESAGSDPVTRARAHAYRAIGLTRLNALDDATDAHLRALEEVESAGLDAELPTYLLNVGTAYHKQGRLGLAREYYARGIRLSNRATRPSTRGLLLANQANIDVSLGRHQEATHLIDRASSIANDHGLRTLRVMCRSIRGDILLASGRCRDAVETYQSALADDSLQLSPYERAELRLACSEAFLQLGNGSSALESLNIARTLIEQYGLDDLEHSYGMLKARQQWSESGSLGTMAGIELFRRHLLSAQTDGNHKLVLRQAPRLMTELQKEGLHELIVEISDVLNTSRNAISMGLTKELRGDFFANLPDLDLPPPPIPSTTPSGPRRAVEAPTSAFDPFYRMLSLNEVILSAPKLRDLLDQALDIALSLSQAERGFVLLRDEQKSRIGEFRIEASQDVGGDPIPSPHLKVSLTIAQEAARTGRTVVTVNARDDRRFNEALSVVDLDLTSVLCVPIRAGSGLLGALYLDHRFRPGVFEGEVPRMMEAFGHQLALAIINARQIAALRAEQEALTEAKEQLAGLLRERELMVEGLQDRCAALADQVEQERAKGGSLRDAFPNIAFASRAMENVLDQVNRVAKGDIPVVVNGESGVGKELIAHAIHQASPRHAGPFIAFNCGAVPENLIESELFGHVKGAFTGAEADRHGLFIVASGGTIFLDEVGEMPMSMQVKLLRVLQERQVRRVGSTESIPTDVRVVAATNRDLATMIDEGTFREDLYYRLAAFTLFIPPLRERREDIPLIGQTLIARIAQEMGRADARLTTDGARLLAQCEWPGNVRELENALRTAVVLSDRAEIGESELAPLISIGSGPTRVTKSRAGETRGRRPKATRESVVDAMRRAGDDRERAAAILGVSERTLYRYLKKYDLY